MSNNKPTSCVDSDGRRYKKSKYCDCCNSPTTSQESEDAGGVDDCDLNEEKWSEWMGHHPNSGEVVRDCDVSVNSQSISRSTYTAEEEESSVLNGAVLHTPEVNKIVPHVASSNPSLSTTATTPSSLERPYRYSSYRKKQLQKLRREQEAIMDSILSKRDSKKEKETFDERLERTQNLEQSTLTQHFEPRSKMEEKKRSYVEETTDLRTDTNEDVLFKANFSVFQSEDELDISPFQIRSKKRDFKEAVENHEKKFFTNPDKNLTKKSRKIQKRPVYKPYAEMTEAEKDSYCLKCNNPMRNCHDVVIGPFCRDAFVRYFHEESKKYADILVAKKIFFANYDNYCEIKEYETTGRLSIPKTKNNPPGCVMHGMFGFCIDWFNYMKNDGFTCKKIDRSKPFVYDINDFKRL